MYYEYHLNDGTIELSNKANISSFPRIVGNYWDGEVWSDVADIDVTYCIIKHGEIPVDVPEVKSAGEFGMVGW